MKTELLFPSGPVTADVTKKGLLAIHTPLHGGKGYVLTHVPTLKVVLRTRLKRDAQAAQKELEALDWETDAEGVRTFLQKAASSHRG